MNQPDRDRLRAIKSFPSLVKYLRDDLEWPIESDDFEDLTYDYTPEELGIDTKSAAKIQEIKQLRPLETNQPWGIFFVKFEPKRLPVVALRRILGKLVFKKRDPTNKSANRAAWDKHDLLFISNYGEGEERQITFAHFTDNTERGDLPTLKVLGWDGEDTPLHLDMVHAQLQQKLRWPDNPASLDQWRKQWSSAFIVGHREVVATSKQLALRLADLARDIRKRCNAAMRIETERGPLKTLMKGFQQALIHDLTEDGFADMYAQTISYGLLSLTIGRTVPGEGHAIVANNLIDVANTGNVFLTELMSAFLDVGGRKWNEQNGKLTGIDFDELGINDVVDTLRHANMQAVLVDFGNRNPLEDPVIHFYELFLKEYDAKNRMQRGVFYTPKPVVSYIVRSVHEQLQTEFGLEDGLASTVTWAQMIMRTPPGPDGKLLELPKVTRVDPKTRKAEQVPIDPNTPFVQILDPATGTATFLVEVIEVIYQTMLAKWKKEGHGELWISQKWNDYVPKHLLPRLHGYELMMAPYAIAHMKIGLKLFETGYKFGSGERARIYLTNALEPPQDFSGWLEQMAPALAHEAMAVNDVKRHQRFTVVIGNPPYSNFGQLNRIPHILDLLEDYKLGLTDKKINLDDDFIKFLRFSEYLIAQSNVGVHGMITNNAFLDGLTHRVLRKHLACTFDRISISNLHGSSKKKEKSPDGSVDENVFDITVGVAIGVFLKSSLPQPGLVRYSDYWGSREAKTEALMSADTRSSWQTLTPDSENFFFVPKDFTAGSEYRAGWSIGDIFEVWQNGIKTDRDELFIDIDRGALEQRMRKFYTPQLDPEFRKQYQVTASSSYDIESRRLATRYSPLNIRPFLYRPMDIRWLYYDPKLTSRPAEKVMKHMIAGNNRGIVTTRQTQEKWDVLAASNLCGHKSCAAYDINTLFPLYVYENRLQTAHTRDERSALTRRPNFSSQFIESLAKALRIPCSDNDEMPQGITPEAVLNYIYAVLHSPVYRARYTTFLRIDFARVPLTDKLNLFRELSRVGGSLLRFHLLECTEAANAPSEYRGHPAPEIETVIYANHAVWLDKKQTCGFAGVPEAVWNFHIGGYQVCEKWLKDRKGRTLSKDDIAHYQKIVVAISETIRLMKEIDEVIEKHGGWPGAFVTTPPDPKPVENTLPFA